MAAATTKIVRNPVSPSVELTLARTCCAVLVGTVNIGIYGINKLFLYGRQKPDLLFIITYYSHSLKIVKNPACIKHKAPTPTIK
jgi:hypothetical protein